jgi:hypothetical protein
MGESPTCVDERERRGAKLAKRVELTSVRRGCDVTGASSRRRRCVCISTAIGLAGELCAFMGARIQGAGNADVRGRARTTPPETFEAGRGDEFAPRLRFHCRFERAATPVPSGTVVRCRARPVAVGSRFLKDNRPTQNEIRRNRFPGTPGRALAAPMWRIAGWILTRRRYEVCDRPRQSEGVKQYRFRQAGRLG